MSRLVYAGLLAVRVVAAVYAAYKTESPLTEQVSPTGEFGGVSLRIEYALTPAARERGLGGRMNLPSDYGMLFVFPEDGYYGFWMKDMLVPIDIFWLDSDGHLVSIISDIATSTYPDVFYPIAPARYVLETAAGFAETHAIATGTPLLLKNFQTVSK